MLHLRGDLAWRERLQSLRRQVERLLDPVEILRQCDPRRCDPAQATRLGNNVAVLDQIVVDGLGGLVDADVGRVDHNLGVLRDLVRV